MTRPLLRWRPADGFHSPRYELIDHGVFAFLWGLVAYVFTMPPPLVTEALVQPLAVFDRQVWGWTLAAIGLAATVAACTLSHRGVDRFYWLILFTFLFWGAQPLIGIAFAGAPVRNLLTTLVFWSHASHVWRSRVRYRADAWE